MSRPLKILKVTKYSNYVSRYIWGTNSLTTINFYTGENIVLSDVAIPMRLAIDSF